MTTLAQAAPDTSQVADFYKTFSAMCFTLLGLWWIVVQLKYKGGTGDPRRRRHAYAVLLFFLLPGVMTMVSAVNADLTTLWRIAFGICGALGLVEVALYASGLEERTRGATVLRVCATVLYLLIVLVSIFPQAAINAGLGLRGQEVESILVALLVVVGVNLAWFGITQPSDVPGGNDEP